MGRLYFLLFFLINIYKSISNIGPNLGDEYFKNFSDEFFQELKKSPFLTSFNNETSVFINGLKVFNIESENFNIESDFAVNAPRSFFLKVHDNDGKVIVTIKCNQCYYFKKKDSIIFIGEIEIKLIKNKFTIYTDYLIYDINEDVFYNNNINEIKSEKFYIKGSKIYFKRDLSYFKILPEIITCKKIF